MKAGCPAGWLRSLCVLSLLSPALPSSPLEAEWDHVLTIVPTLSWVWLVTRKERT